MSQILHLKLSILTFYEKDDTEAVESMRLFNILNIDIKGLNAKELDVTYEFDPSLDSSSELDLSLCFAATSPRIRVTRFRVSLLPSPIDISCSRYVKTNYKASINIIDYKYELSILSVMS